MYETVGYIVGNGTVYCPEHAQEYFQQEYDIKTEEETDFLFNAHPSFMSNTYTSVSLWPVHLTVDGYTYDYIYEEDGTMIMYTDYQVPKDDRIWDIKKEVHGVADDGTWEDGLYCEKCDKELIEPDRIRCEHENEPCGEETIIGEGSEESEYYYAHKYTLNETLCKKHYAKEEEEDKNAIIDSIEQHLDSNELSTFYALKKHIAYIQKTPLFEALPSLEKKTSLADMQDETPNGIVLLIIQGVIENSLIDYTKMPYYLAAEKIRKGERLK